MKLCSAGTWRFSTTVVDKEEYNDVHHDSVAGSLEWPNWINEWMNKYMNGWMNQWITQRKNKKKLKNK